ncbi:MAG TPA: transporter, partial [Balneola sp.]|nr:transporter [Balneola sp.]
YIKYLLAGIFFGIVLIKSEVVSWFRIQEMFRFDSFHMYGIIGLGVVVAMISIQVIKRKNIKDMEGNAITIPPKDPKQVTRYIVGGTLFGFGWALTGACPGPLFSLAGAGYSIMIVPILSALAGTWVYGKIRPSLPH